jgi:four helix bundle protein
MSKFEKFEDIVAWQKARVLARRIYLVTDQNKFRQDFVLKQQITRAAISVVSNIAEGFARRTNKEFTQFLYISHGSMAEMEAQLYIALDLGYISNNEFNEIYASCNEIPRMIMGLIKYLSGARPASIKRNKELQDK